MRLLLIFVGLLLLASPVAAQELLGVPYGPLDTATVSDSTWFPVLGRTYKSIKSFFGVCRAGCRRRHRGVDIFAPKNTEVVAVTAGVVTAVKVERLGGRVVWISDAKQDVRYYYAHLTKQLVSKGDTVKAGQVIGTVGNTGNAKYTASHLHFGVYKKRSATDPIRFFNWGNTK